MLFCGTKINNNNNNNNNNNQDRVITEDRLAGDSKDIEKNIEQLIELDSTMYYLSLLDVVR